MQIKPYLRISFFIALMWALNFLVDAIHKITVLTGIPKSIETLIYIAAFLFGLKLILLKSMPGNVDFIPTNIEDFSWLDTNKLSELTTDFEKLGFTNVLDYTVDSKSNIRVECFARFLLNPESKCFAEIDQAKPYEKAVKTMEFSIGSIADNDWLIGITSRKPNKINWLLRRSKDIWEYHPNMDVKQSFCRHLEQRGNALHNYNIQTINSVSVNSYLEFMKKRCTEQKHILKQKSIFTIPLVLLYFTVHPRTSWQSDFRQM